VSDGELLKDLVRLAREEGVLEGEGLEAFAGALQERARRIVEERLGSLEAETAWRREAMRGLELENQWRREAMTGTEREMAWRREAMAGLERENTWRREEMDGLQRENEWRREAVEALQRENTWRREAAEALQRENAWRREAVEGLERESAWRREAMTGLERENAGRLEALARLEESLRALQAWAGGLQAERADAEAAHRSLLEHHRSVLRLVVAELGGVASLPLFRLREARRRLAALRDLLGREGS
jgi:chromosome segregation ATPase